MLKERTSLEPPVEQEGPEAREAFHQSIELHRIDRHAACVRVHFLGRVRHVRASDIIIHRANSQQNLVVSKERPHTQIHYVQAQERIIYSHPVLKIEI